MAIGAIIGGLAGAAGSFFGAKQQGKDAEKAQKRQIAQLNAAAEGLRTDYQGVIDQIMRNPAGYAGSRVQAALYNPVSLSESLRGTLGANTANFGRASTLARMTNEDTLANDMARFAQFNPQGLATFGNLGRQAQSLSAGQLPQDVLQQIIGARAGSSAASGVPGGQSPATLRDLGLSSLDAINQGGSLFQQIIAAAEGVSPISRQMSAAQYQFDPNTGLQTDLTQALLGQQSQQNFFNLAATPDPALAMQAQLQLQMANSVASTKAGIASLPQAAPMPYAQLYGQIGNALGQGIGALFGGGGNSGGGFSSGFGSGGSNYGGYSSPSDYNAYALSYNQNLSGSAAPKAYYVNY